ncbi:hypothetical protein UFOVP842_49 [uncultured Caudovirales phage]|uniref:Uncharacterized protein n=1 Tax=uncultured Caudovirales phage TaxID=2100421 RepID=A0A6J5LQE0_9CAUD|nr:hypothetical protein UFOVP305_6 [uncultured Caudovirales phage]CAB4151912.1 hypothetical protein UFOVP593_39 [uncultured Caudovirales phage]CAB4166757.1 hypothetical protein UFOVP842_49 [uncultured Caudovirales phage]
MTAGVKRGLTIALTSTFVGVAAIPLLVALWRTKVDVSVYDVHIEKESTRVVRDSARAEEQHMLLLDVLCATKPTDRRCH